MKLFVAQYGIRENHPGPRHWSLLLALSNDANSKAQAFQLTGNWVDGFVRKVPETVTPLHSQSFLGMVHVGEVDVGKYLDFVEDVKAVPVVNSVQSWHCQHWVVDVLEELKKKGYAVRVPSHGGLLAELNGLL
ncbi:hypothetical protein BJ165DRAFT_1482461 [Panaeolus papilionaceus]|nr:hypothetical protein BJ165DRAFT_1482461 [Panaeolus papilionaceus]